jgi:Tfp pilus assembly PilM family ATPase
MSRLLALEWNGSEARLAVASMRGEGVLIEQAFSVELRPRQVGADKSEVDVGARLAAALAVRSLGRLDTLVAIGRTNIELRQLLLPPAPDDELPEMVRFQAMREFNEFDEQWLLDFVPLGDEPDQPRTVLAAAIGPDLVTQIQQTCQAAGLKQRRLVLRACAAAALLARAQATRQGELRLLIDFLSDEADLTVMSDGRVVFLRTTRIGGDPPQPQVLIGEVRRTMAAVQNQLGGRKVDSIVLCGRGAQHADLAQRIENELAVPTELFDPFEGLNLSEELRAAPPEHPGRVAPVLGLLLAELEHTGHAVDFMHPRRRREPPRKWKRYVFPAVGAVVVIGTLLGWWLMERSSLNAQIQDLKDQSKSWKDIADKAADVQEKTAQIEKWTVSDLCWLDELEVLSRKFPPAADAMVTKLNINPTLTGGELSLDGLAKSAATIKDIEQALSDPTRHVEGKGSREDEKVKPYSRGFSGSLIIDTVSPPSTPPKSRK